MSRDEATLRLIACGIAYFGCVIKYGLAGLKQDMVVIESGKMVDAAIAAGIAAGIWPLPEEEPKP